MSSQALWSLTFCLVACGCVDRATVFTGGEATSPAGETTAPDPAPAQSQAGAPGEPGGASQTQTGASHAPAGGSQETAGVTYVPRVSEQELQEFLHRLDDAALAAVTDEQVFAIMGQPTRRDPPITGRRGGQVITVYEAHWEAPGGAYSSTIGFVNGRMDGMALGVEFTPREAGGSD